MPIWFLVVMCAGMKNLIHSKEGRSTSLVAGAMRLAMGAALLLALLSGRRVEAVGPAPSPPQGNRFLFVLDASFSMDRLSSALRKSLGTMIDSGLNGQMQTGDTYGIWTFSDRLNTDFPMQVWYETQKAALAGKASDFIRKQRFSKRGTWEPVLGEINSVITAVQDLTVVLLTDGDTELKGIRFAPEINAAIRPIRNAMHDDKKPIILVLAARHGEIVAWAINSPDTFLELPSVPVQKAAAIAAPSIQPSVKGPAATTQSNLSLTHAGGLRLGAESNGNPPSFEVPAQAVVVKPTARPVKPRDPIIITRESVAAEKAALASNLISGATEPKTPVPVPAPSNSPPVVTTTAPLTPTNAVAVTVTTNSSPASNAPPMALLSASNQEPVPMVLTKSPEIKETVYQSKVESNTPMVSATAPVATAGRGGYVIMGIVMAVVAIVAWLFGRQRGRSQHEPSLITRSLLAQNGTHATMRRVIPKPGATVRLPSAAAVVEAPETGNRASAA